MSGRGFVADLLVRKGVVNDEALARAAAMQSTRPATLGKTLAALGVTDEWVVASLVAEAMHLEFIAEIPPAEDAAAELLPAEFCRKRRTFPLSVKGNVLRLAVCDPLDLPLVQDVAFRTGKKVVAVVATQTEIERAIAAVYPAAAEPASITSYDMLADIKPSGEIEALHIDEGEIDAATLVKDTSLAPVIRLVNLILSDAAKAGASDIHIEPQESCVQVRQRVDGLLRESMTLPLNLRDQAISRLKIISGMDIAERRKPQDGRSRLRFEGRRIDLRVSTLPTQFGEKVVVRLLNTGAARRLDQLDLSSDHLKQLHGFLGRTRGLVLVTGPTGSGKTSTLYAALSAIKSPTNNIITLEDPIEFQVQGVNQTQINPRAGVTFASGLRSILRQDPNVILVGEIRDQETAEIALQAAQTGHLLLSTLHTNDAASTVTRLFDLGVPPFLVASSLVGVLAQRLVRRVCPKCAIQKRPSNEAVERIGKSRLPSDARWMAGAGCEECGGTGLKGRIAIHEVLSISDDVRELISSRAPDLAIRNAARRAGMQTLLEDGIAKAAQGLTTLEEVLQVASASEEQDLSEVAAAPAPSPMAAAAPASVTTPGRAAAEGRAASESGANRRVLVVEDNPTISSVVKYFLELEGFDVMLAADGRAGLDLALDQPPDLIVSDVRMPGMSGTEMVKQLRTQPSTAATRILMLTSEESVEIEAEALTAGADDYILKPVEPRRLAARVKALLARSAVGVAAR